MFVFPLGLDAKSRRLPLVTILILVGTVAYSVLRFSDQHQSIKKELNSPKSQSLFEARKALTLAECAELKLEVEDCDFLRKTLPQLEGPNWYSARLDLQRKVERIYEEDADRKLEAFNTYLFDDQTWLKSPWKNSRSKEYLAYQEAHELYQREKIQELKKHHALAPANFGWRSLLEAQLTHGGWMHLIGNMVFFLLLAIPVEERLGPLAFAFFYILGGSVGLSLQLPFFDDPTLGLLGASANVSAIAGLFLVLFPKTQMRVWVSYLFLINKTAKIPTWIFIPLFLILQDVIGALENTSSIAHIAHLGGLASGVGLGFAWKKLRPLPSHMIFPFEKTDLNQAYRSEHPLERIRLAHRILFHNEKNTEAQNLLLASALAEEEQSKPALKALELNFQFIFKNRLESQSPEEFLSFLTELPRQWPVSSWVREANLEKLVSTASLAKETQRFDEAILIFEILKTCHPSVQFKEKAKAQIENLKAMRDGHEGVSVEKVS